MSVQSNVSNTGSFGATSWTAIMGSGSVGSSDYTIQVRNNGPETVYLSPDAYHAYPLPAGQTSPVFSVKGTGAGGDGNFSAKVANDGNTANLDLIYTF